MLTTTTFGFFLAVAFLAFVLVALTFFALALGAVLRAFFLTSVPLARAMINPPCRESASCRSTLECAPAECKDGNPPDAARCTPPLPCRLPPTAPRRGCACPRGPR